MSCCFKCYTESENFPTHCINPACPVCHTEKVDTWEEKIRSLWQKTNTADDYIKLFHDLLISQKTHVLQLGDGMGNSDPSNDFEVGYNLGVDEYQNKIQDEI